MEYVILGLGSNAGNRAQTLAAAVSALRAQIERMVLSSVHETAALLPEGAPPEWDMPYLNQAAGGWTALAPHALLAESKRIEAALGRRERGRWGPREIDIDILAYGSKTIEDIRLSIPHPQLLARNFALKPLAEIAPEWVYPGGTHKGKTAAQLAAEFFP